MTREKIIQQVAEMSAGRTVHWKDDQRLHQFSESVREVPDSVVFDALISFFSWPPSTKEKSDEQDCAATLLALRLPNPTKDLSDVISDVVYHWDVSVEQLPWYFALISGRENFRARVNRLLKKGRHSKRIEIALDTLLYWTSLPEDRMRRELALSR